MGLRHLCSAGAVATVITATAAFTQTREPSAQASVGQGERQVTLIGCLQRESDYRKQNNSGRGGAAATGVGLGNEFVLVNATMAGASATAPRSGAATTATSGCTGTGGEAYELTGNRERDVASFVGRQIEITGMLKEAKTEQGTAGTSGTGARPTGGFDPLGQDLELFEVNVTSFREAPAAGASAPQAQPAPASPARPAPQAPRDTTTPRTEPAPRLPQTASPAPLAGLLGLFSLAGAIGLRARRS